MPLYDRLTESSTPEQIADVYGGVAQGSAANQNQPQAPAAGPGITGTGIAQTYGLYNQPGVTFSEGMAGKSAQDKAIEYNNLLGQGFSDAAIRSAADAQFGDQTNYWSELTGLAGNLASTPLNQNAPVGAGISALYDPLKSAFGVGVNGAEQEAFRALTAADINKQFGITEPGGKPTTEGVLSGFKYIKDSGIDEQKLREAIGEDAFNAYKTGFSDYAKSGIASILSDGKLSFDEARDSVKFGREYGYDSQKLADLTGQKKELFDTINKTYEDTTNKIVNGVLGADDVKTDGDKIIKALALQQKYGFTDDDLAKAIDLTPEQVKDYLNPLRNYEASYKETLSKPDLSGGDVLKFLEESKKNEGINTAYGSKIDEQIAKLEELNQKWSGYKVDGYQAENIYNQINKITEAAGGKNWSGDWMSGGENAKLETTRLLIDKGVDNLSDLGVEKNYKQTSADAEFYNGQHVRKDEYGQKYILTTTSSGDSEYSSPTYLPADAQTTPGRAVAGGSGGDTYTNFVPLTEEELKTYDPKTNSFEEAAGNKLIDKSTGKTISTSNDNKFTLDSYNTGNFFAGRSKQLGIMMTDDGVPVPYQTSQREGFKYSPAFPIMMSMLAPGVGSAISGALPGAGVAASGATAAISPTLMNTALTQGIMGAGTAALTGQDILKGAILGGISAPISTGINSLLPAGMDPNMARSITGAGTGFAKGLLQGGDFEDLLGQGVLSGLTNYGFGELSRGVGNTFNLTPDQLNLAAGIAAPLLQGKNVNPMNLIGPLVKMGQQQTTKATS
jgi:hypothetical protein